MAQMSQATLASKRPPWLVIFLCWCVVVLDGYDLIIYGTTLPQILNEDWGMSATNAGLIASFGFFGMMLGALGAGTIADALGRRKAILICSAVFTLITFLTAFAPNQEIFGVLRFLAGLGLGGLMPSTNALCGEFVSSKNRAVASTIMLSGIPLGGSAAAVLGLLMLPTTGWRSMYLLAGVGFILLIAIWFLLPESPTWLRAKGREEEAKQIAQRWGVIHTLEFKISDVQTSDKVAKRGAVFRAPWLSPLLLFCIASMFTMFTWYGLGTWLPNIMNSDAHFKSLMPDPLVFLLSMNIGAVLGSFFTAWVATKIGPLRSSIITAIITVPALLFLITVPESGIATMVALLLAGVGGHGTTCLITAAIVGHFPPQLRGKALGLSASAGRIGGIAAPYIAGSMIDAGIGTSGNFLMFAIGAFLAVITLVVAWFALRSRGTEENKQNIPEKHLLDKSGTLS